MLYKRSYRFSSWWNRGALDSKPQFNATLQMKTHLVNLWLRVAANLIISICFALAHRVTAVTVVLFRPV